ncbi:MORC family CW-type zinc finger protein 4 [Gossypium australe]|uniref:MORC family CW-type zinc finger protein 4 n=1 Tax=Gossypium australe TaxID=47621 RepID=A0A5B6VQK7_9ROSI|nr:MORC family CW-type zinc finger protein 4 [Gossypium australe]
MQQQLLTLLPQGLLFYQFKHHKAEHCSSQSQSNSVTCRIRVNHHITCHECGKCCCLWERSFYYLQVGHLDADRCWLNNMGSRINREAAYGSMAMVLCFFIFIRVSMSGTTPFI